MPSRTCRRFLGLCLLFLCSVTILARQFSAQTPAQSPTAQPAPSAAVVVVEIHCKPGTAVQWRQSFEKEIVPAIREAIRKGDTFTGFSYLEAPLLAQNVDYVLIFEAKSFAALDTRRLPPHYEVLFQRLGPERAGALLKEMGDWEERVTVNIYRSYKVER